MSGVCTLTRRVQCCSLKKAPGLGNAARSSTCLQVSILMMRSKNRARTFIFCYKKITLVASVSARTEQARSVFFFSISKKLVNLKPYRIDNDWKWKVLDHLSSTIKKLQIEIKIWVNGGKKSIPPPFQIMSFQFS